MLPVMVYRGKVNTVQQRTTPDRSSPVDAHIPAHLNI